MNERLRILKMVEEGKISADKAAELLKALEQNAEKKPVARKKKWLRIYVESRDDNERVNIKIPISMIKLAKHFMKDVQVGSKNVDIDELLKQIEEGEELISVESDEELVKIWVE